MASSVTVAILTLPPLPPTSISAPWAQVTFISEAGQNEVLQVAGPQPGEKTSIRPGVWLPLYATYSWDQANGKIFWGITTSLAGSALTTNGVAGINKDGVKPTSTPTPSSNTTPANSASTEIVPESGTLSSLASMPSAATPTSRSKNTSSGISSGAVAGIAIGCLIAGALLAGLVLWFCWRRRRAPTKNDREASKIALMPQEKGFSTKAISLGSRSTSNPPVSGDLPQPQEDKAITGEISKISNSVKNHVQSYYHSGRVSPGIIDFDDVQALGGNMPVTVGTLSTLLGNSATREIALRYAIAWVICSRMLPSTGSNASFLPTEVAGCSQVISKTQPSSSSHAAVLARWRSSTSELLQSAYVHDPFTASDSRNSSIQAAIRDLDNILQPYADSRMDNEQRRRNLEEILKRSALFAFTLFSQPSTWEFDWMAEQSVKSGELCIFPALVQLTNGTGEAVWPPRPFSEAVVRRLDG